MPRYKDTYMYTCLIIYVSFSNACSTAVGQRCNCNTAQCDYHEVPKGSPISPDMPMQEASEHLVYKPVLTNLYCALNNLRCRRAGQYLYSLYSNASVKQKSAI